MSHRAAFAVAVGLTLGMMLAIGARFGWPNRETRVAPVSVALSALVADQPLHEPGVWIVRYSDGDVAAFVDIGPNGCPMAWFSAKDYLATYGYPPSDFGGVGPNATGLFRSPSLGVTYDITGRFLFGPGPPRLAAVRVTTAHGRVNVAGADVERARAVMLWPDAWCSD